MSVWTAYRDAFPCLWERRGELNREEKQQVVAGLKEKFQKAKAMVITDYKGMTVAEMSELRDALRSPTTEYRVVKNTLARIAAEDTPIAVAKDFFKGPVGIALGYDDPTVVAKSILEFVKKNQKLKISSSVIDGRLCTPEELRAIAELPPRDVLLSMLAGTMQAPLGKLARLLSETLNRFAYALNALKDKKSSGQ